MNQECHYFHKSICRKGNSCIFKHTEPKAGKCLNLKCKVCLYENGKQRNVIDSSKSTLDLKKEVTRQVIRQKIEKSQDIIKKIQQKIYEPVNEVEDQKIQKVQQKQDSVFQNITDQKNYVYQARIRQANQDLQIFKPLEKIFQSKLSLDLMFILDCTGSMTSWIKACKDELSNIITQVLYEHEGATINISIVAYRDIKDHKRFQVLPFTRDKDIVRKFISQLLAMGGGDTPEDICGAFEQALNQSWNSTAKYAVLITDAPCHGKKYHACDDSYPNGDPNGLKPENQIEEFVKRGINLYGIKITNITDKMYEIFSEVYQNQAKTPMCIGNLGQNTKSFGFYIASTVTATLSASVINSDVSYIKRALKQLKLHQKDKKLTAEKQLEILMKIQSQPVEKNEVMQTSENANVLYYDKKFQGSPKWQSLQQSNLYDCIEHTYFIVKDKGVAINWRKPLIQNSQITSKVRICKLPFSEGGMRYAFYAYDTVLQQKLVTKRNKKQKLNNIKEMSKDLQLVYICQHIVNTFNDAVVQLVPDTRLLLTFVHTFLVELKNQNKFFYAENFIDGDYQKFNNNAGWENNKVSQSSLISQAFSHYSYQFTEGYLMVVDIQGSSGILTDPQIHCLDYERFGSGNLGYQGILKFFFNHRCNHYCKSLGLIHPKHQSSLPQNFNFYSQQIKKPADLKKRIFTICDLCKGAYSSTAGFVYNKRIEDQMKYCGPCDEKRRNSMRKGSCEWCKTTFNSSQYWFKMMRTDFPTLCGQCRKKRREQWRLQLIKNQEPVQQKSESKIIKSSQLKINTLGLNKQSIVQQKKQNKLSQNEKKEQSKPQIWQTYRFNIQLFQNSDQFKLWMSEIGLVFMADYRNLRKVTNDKQIYGKFEMLTNKASVVIGKLFKGAAVNFLKK